MTTTLLDQSPRSEAASATSDLTLDSGKTSSNAPQGLLDLGLRVNVGLPGLPDVQAGVSLTVGEQGAALAVNTGATVSLGGSAADGNGQMGSSLALGLALNTSGETAPNGERTGPSLDLSLSLNSPGGTVAGSGGTSSGTSGNGSGLGGQGTKSTPGTTTPGTPPFQTNPSPVLLFGTNLAAEAAATTSLITLSSPMAPTVGLPAHAGLSTHTQSSAPATADEDARLASSLGGLSEQGLSQRDKDGVDEIKAALASYQAPGRPGSSPSRTSPGAGEGSNERSTPRDASVAPSSEVPEIPDTPEGSLWFLPMRELLGLDSPRPEGFGPIGNLTGLFLEDLGSIPRSLEQMMEGVEADGLSVTSWVLLGLAAVATCEIARRQLREDSSLDIMGEPAGGPAVV